MSLDFRLADTVTAALARLPAADQKAVKVSVLDLQLDPSAPGLQMHRIDLLTCLRKTPASASSTSEAPSSDKPQATHMVGLEVRHQMLAYRALDCRGDIATGP